MNVSLGLPPGALPVDTTWMIAPHVAAVLEIEERSFAEPLTVEEITAVIRSNDCNGMVALSRGQPVGFAIYRFDSRELEILDIAVAPEHRRRRVAAQMVARLASRLKSSRKSRIFVDVPDVTLHAQLFFKACGFKAVQTIHDPDGDDYYRMCYPPPIGVPYLHGVRPLKSEGDPR